MRDLLGAAVGRDYAIEVPREVARGLAISRPAIPNNATPRDQAGNEPEQLIGIAGARLGICRRLAREEILERRPGVRRPQSPAVPRCMRRSCCE